MWHKINELFDFWYHTPATELHFPSQTSFENGLIVQNHSLSYQQPQYLTYIFCSVYCKTYIKTKVTWTQTK